MIATANPIPSSVAASHRAATLPSLELLEARRVRDGLATLLRAERTAAAEFLLALSDFDRHRDWERLGYASLFAFLHVELGFSKGGAFFRQTAARLLQRFPEVIEPLRDGRLCITTVVELAKVLTETNRAEVMPRFYGCSSQEAKEVVAALMPMASPPVRAVVTKLAAPVAVAQATAQARAVAPRVELPELPMAVPLQAPATAETAAVQLTEPLLNHPARDAERRAVVEPLTAELRRLHITVDAQFLKMLDTARDGLSHSIPGASMEQVLKAALELLLEKQARARGLVKKPRTVVATAAPAAPVIPAMTAIPVAMPGSAPARVQAPGTTTATATATAPAPATVATETPPMDFAAPLHRRPGPREQVSAATRRAVWERDGGRCSWPLDGGGVCGSTHRLKLDHIVPWARWGGEAVEDLRVVCHQHNALAARQAFGERCVARYSRRPLERSS